RGFSEAALKALDAYRWPGNVRELENTIERAVVLCRGDVVGLEDLPEPVSHSTGREQAAKDGVFVPFGTPLEEVERRLIAETLKRTGGDKKTAARLLGIAARTIYRKLGEQD
ncbi:MAG: sigma-54-dependent Fis family transcriptional regulator, partial [Deltaproteobacteria bacterium]|nr:sigma-54-dependent Fis family transcriptional regulator [Deltaproteobacteria bacterium]